MTLVMVVDDDQDLAEMLGIVLTGAGIDVDLVSRGDEVMDVFRNNPPDLVLLDVMLPGLDGIEVCKLIRAESMVPIVMLSAKGDTQDVVKGLEVGADDYMVKPFGMRELVARIRAVARRAGPADTAPTAATQDIGPLSIDRRTQKVFVNGQDVYLTPKEFGLLAYLATDPGAVYRRNDIMSEVWDTNWYGTTKTVDAHVAALRKKLGNQEWIEAVRGVGFRLGVPDS